MPVPVWSKRRLRVRGQNDGGLYLVKMAAVDGGQAGRIRGQKADPTVADCGGQGAGFGRAVAG